MTSSIPESSGPDTIVLIHGLWMTPLSWEHWVERYSSRGFKAMAPAWPGMEGSVEELRRDPTPIARQSIPAILDHYERIIRSLPKPPIIIGHSFGGGFTQVLLDRGLGAAGVGIAAATVRGVYDLPPSTLRSAFSLLRNPLLRHRAVPISAKDFNYAFTNNLSPEQSEPIYQRYAVPGSRNVLLTGANANLNPATPMKVKFRNNDRAPLLFIADGNDHVVPAIANRHNAAKYRHSTAITAYKEFAGRTHYTLGQPGWEEVADYALDWALNPRPAPVDR
jgi:alpha-beta hydrolase superfamily lysophospholipase